MVNEGPFTLLAHFRSVPGLRVRDVRGSYPTGSGGQSFSVRAPSNMTRSLPPLNVGGGLKADPLRHLPRPCLTAWTLSPGAVGRLAPVVGRSSGSARRGREP